jgi:antitoxin HicB
MASDHRSSLRLSTPQLRRQERRPIALPSARMTEAAQPPPTVDHYLDRPYHVAVVQDSKDKKSPWLASVEELPGCESRGKSPAEATAGIEAAMAAWVTKALEEGKEIPEPKPAVEPKTASGRLLLRMPRTLHTELAGLAEREGVSLNQFITDVLAAAVGWRKEGGNAGSPSVTSQKPGADALIPEPSAFGRRSTRMSPSMVNAVLIGNFVVVAIAGIIAILVLIAAWN